MLKSIPRPRAFWFALNVTFSMVAWSFGTHPQPFFCGNQSIKQHKTQVFLICLAARLIIGFNSRQSVHTLTKCPLSNDRGWLRDFSITKFSKDNRPFVFTTCYFFSLTTVPFWMVLWCKFSLVILLGHVAIGNMNAYLPFILKEIESNAKRQYLLLHSLKEVCSRYFKCYGKFYI